MCFSLLLASCFARDDTDVFRSVLGSYEDRHKMLLSENGDMRNALLDLQKQLVAMLRADDGHSADRSSASVCVTSFYLLLMVVVYLYCVGHCMDITTFYFEIS